jgi:hypothetical protein
LYVSNIKLLETGKTDNIYIEKDSYHLLRFPDGQPFSFYLDQVPDFPFDRIQLTIGIDQEANSSIETPGDLDPTNQMAWNWTSGYKFLLLEGLYTPGDMGEVIPLVYHIGFSENARQVEFDLQSGREIRFNIEITDLFRSPHPIDFHITPKVLFNEEDAAIIAMNYGEEFLLLQQTTTGQHKTQGRTGLKLN